MWEVVWERGEGIKLNMDQSDVYLYVECFGSLINMPKLSPIFTYVIVRWETKENVLLLIHFCETKALVSCVEQVADFGENTVNKAIEGFHKI